MTVNQELYCHNCNRYVQFRIDNELDGEHIVKCPNCNHEHYRHVDHGKITDRRWGSANRGQQSSYRAQVWGYTTASTSTASTNTAFINSTGNATINWTYGSYGNSMG